VILGPKCRLLPVLLFAPGSLPGAAVRLGAAKYGIHLSADRAINVGVSQERKQLP